MAGKKPSVAARPAKKRRAPTATRRPAKPPAVKAGAPGRTPTPKRRAAKATKSAAGVEAALAAVVAAEPIVPNTALGARTVLYVHGIGNKPPASVLKAQWDQALFEFDLGERSRLAYWVDRERYPVPEAGVSSGGDYADDNGNAPTGEFSPKAVRESWNAATELERIDADIAEMLGEAGVSESLSGHAARLRGLAETMLAANALTDDENFKRLIDRQRGPDGAAVRRIQAQRYGVAAVEAKVFGFIPRPMRQWLTRTVTKLFLRDVNDLFVDQEKSQRMRDSVRERLRVGGGPFVVVAHSQGTMIAYAVLMEPEFAHLEIPLFVTIGSPLAIHEVQDFIKELTKQQQLRVPPSVRRWVNVCDPFDPVALDKTLRSEYSANERGVRAEDFQKFNPDSPRHPHSATGYLALEQVREPVRTAVNTSLFQPVATFAMARDVVRAFADARSEERHRILVQLQEFASSEMSREQALAKIYAVLGAEQEGSDERQRLDPEELQRYVALNLTREEAERLGSAALGDTKFPVARIWKNSAKWAYVDRSIHTTQAFPAHNSYHADGADITWAVLDSGIHWTHPHFGVRGGTIARVFDCTDPRERRRRDLRELSPTVPDDAARAADRFGHGAHVAGIIAGRHTARDRQGRDRVMSGMAPEAKLVIYKVLDNNGSGEDSWIIKAIDHIFETNERAGRIVIHGVNLSLGGDFDVEAFNCGHTPLCVELRRLWRQGVVVVLAAGNEGFASLSAANGDTVQANMGMSLGDPANLEEAIVVGSVHKDRPHTYGTSFFSSRGPTADGRMKPDCVAPGERIFSVRNDAPESAMGLAFEQLYTEMSGTSMAAPHVSGLIAAFLSKRQEFIGDPDRVKDILLKNCTDLQRQRSMQGAGMPNVVKMLVNV